MKKGFPPAPCCVGCGQCCRRLPGSAYPEDVEPLTVEGIQAKLETGKWCFDKWEDFDGGSGMFLRPATKNRVGQRVDYSWGGECCFLGDDGCALPFNERPFECRMLEPKEDWKNCVAHYESKYDAAKAWAPYEKMIFEALEWTNETR